MTIRRGSIFWAPVAGKQRPVVVLTRDMAITFLDLITVAPVSRRIRGIPSEVVLEPGLDGVREPSAINFDTVMTIPKSSLGRRVGDVSAGKLDDVCQALTFALGC